MGKNATIRALWESSKPGTRLEDIQAAYEAGEASGRTEHALTGQIAATPNNGSTLMPCPFCGTAPKLKSGKVKCANNQCKVQPKIAAWYAAGYDELAVADWNTRMSFSENVSESEVRNG